VRFSETLSPNASWAYRSEADWARECKGGFTTYLISEVAREAVAVVAAVLRAHRPAVLTDDFFAGDHGVLWDKVARTAVLQLGAPSSKGGADAGLADLTAVAAEWGRHLFPVPATLTMFILRYGNVSEAVRFRPLTIPIQIGDMLCTVPFLNCPHVICVGSLHDSMEVRANSVGLISRDAFVPSLPRTSIHFESALGGHQLDELATLLAAEATGCASQVLDMTVSYAEQRVQFGQQIGRFQAVKHMLANMYCDLELARTAVLWSACSQNGTHLRRPALEALKLCRRVVEAGIQVHGGMGFTWEAGVHFYLRHILALSDIVRRGTGIEGTEQHRRQ